MATAAAGVSVSGGGKGCGGGLVEPENGGVTAWVGILSAADEVPIAASIPAGTGGDVEGELVDGGGVEAIGDGPGAAEASGDPENGGVTAWVGILSAADEVPIAASIPAGTGGDAEGELVDGDGGGVEAIGDGPGAPEASGDPENGGVTAFNCDESAEGAFASVTICSGGSSGAAGSPWKAIASSEYLLRARSETNPSVRSRRCSGVLVAGRSGTLARAGKGSVALGVRSVDAA
jgi:hypothetical protein